jgi:hypothetical protein
MSLGKLGARGGFASLGLLGGGGRPYNPMTALGPSLLAWWDADQSYWGANGSMTMATGVSSWKDIVAGYNATQATGSAQPTFSSTSFGGKPGVSFDGVDDNLLCTDAGLLAVLPTGATPCELWVLVENDAPASDATIRYAFGYGNAGPTQREIGRAVVSGVNRGRVGVGDGTSALGANDTGTDLSTRHAMRAQYGATASSIIVDADAGASLSVIPGSTATRLRIGAQPNAGAIAIWQGPIAAAFITLPLTTAQAAQHQNWLLGRRNIVPQNSLTLQSSPLTLGGQYLTLGN